MPRPRQFDEAAVLERARDLFWERGYAATSIQDLEKGLGIKRSSLYSVFGSKRALYERTLRKYQADNLAYLRAHFARGGDLRDAVRAMFMRAVDAQLHDPDRPVGCYIVGATSELAAVDAEIFAFIADNRAVFVDILTTAFTDQGHAAAEAATTANFLFTFYNGLQIAIKTGMDRAALCRVVDTAVARI